MEAPTYVHPSLRPALRETFGVIVYHEQVMRTLAAMAGYSLTEADYVRRHLDDDTMLTASGGLPPAREGPRVRRRGRRADLGRRRAVRVVRVLQGPRGGVRRADVPVRLAEDALPGALPRGHPHARSRHVPATAAARGRPRHGIPILPLDVNASEPEYVVEAAEGRYGIRLALQDVHGISDAEIRSILEARADRRSRTWGLPAADDGLETGGRGDRARGRVRRDRPGTRRDRLYAAMTTAPSALAISWPSTCIRPRRGRGSRRRAGPSIGSPPRVHRRRAGAGRARGARLGREPAPRDLLRAVARGPRRDPFARPAPVPIRPAGHGRRREGGVADPAIRSGQRIIFLTLDDATGPVEVVVFESVQPRVAKTVFHSFLLAVVGTVRRTGRRASP